MIQETPREVYVTSAINFAFRYGYKEVTPHIIDVMVSIMMTKDDTMHGGSFVRAVCDNNLDHAVTLADDECINYLRLFSLTSRYCNIKNKGL